jgi:hypothetical protein
MGASPLEGKFPKIIKPTSLRKILNAILPTSLQKFPGKSEEDKKCIMSLT